MSKGKRERKIRKKTLIYTEQTDGYQKGGRWGMAEAGDGDDHRTRVIYGNVESLYYTPEANITLYVNYTGI